MFVKDGIVRQYLRGNGFGAHLSDPLPPSVASQLATLTETLGAHGRKLRTLALVSPRSGEGTSTCVVNLGRYLAGNQHARVLMVDANPYFAALHSLTGVEAAGGLAELLDGEIPFDAAIKATSLDELFLVTNGVRSPFSTNGLLHPAALRERLLKYSGGYDYVLVDCPAVNVNEDAAMIAAQCDGVILVIDGRTHWHSAQAAKTLLMRANCNILGVFMNKHRFHIPQFLYDRL